MSGRQVMKTQVWLVTGSSRGLGRAFTEAALEAEHRVVATARNSEHLIEIACTFGESVRAVSLDVTSEAQAKSAVDAAIETFGGLDVLVNNASYVLIPGRTPRSRASPVILGQLEQEPDSTLGLVEDILYNVARRRVAPTVAQIDRGALALGDLPVVVEQPPDHLRGRHVVVIIIRDPLKPADVPNAPECGPADFSHALSQHIHGFQDGRCMFVEQEMVITEARAGQVPVKVFRFHVQREGIRDQRVRGLGDH